MDYSKGKIYKIESYLGPKIYIGSTTKHYLSDRLASHHGDYKRWKQGLRSKITSFNIFEEYGIKNCRITLIESCSYNSKDELKSREAHFIRSMDCVNKQIPCRTLKEYLCENKEKIRELAANPYLCECGSMIRHQGKIRHERSKKHLNYLASKTE